MAHGIFRQSCAIYRATRTPDGDGGWSETYALQSTVTGRLQPASGREQFLGQRDDEAVIWNFAAPGGTDVQKGDQVRADGRVVIIDAVLPSATGQRIVANGHEFNAGG